MKFVYVDESGHWDQQGDIFTMCGLMVDAYFLRKATSQFDHMLREMLDQHQKKLSEFKTSVFITGKNKWSSVGADKRKEFLREILKLATETGNKIFGIALSFKSFNETAAKGTHKQPFKKDYWLGAAMFTACLIQKRTQSKEKNKGRAVVIMDDNKQGTANLSDGLYRREAWYDGLYKIQQKKRGKTFWKDRSDSDRFDHIINTAFAIKSHHSSLIQVADAICYVYRRHLELHSCNEEWPGERKYIADLVQILESSREKIGRVPDEPCCRFYQEVKHPEWKL